MLDSLTKTMSRSGGLVGGLNKKSNSSIGGVGGGSAVANVTAGSGTLSNGSHNSSTTGGRGTFQAQVIFLDDSGQVSLHLVIFAAAQCSRVTLVWDSGSRFVAFHFFRFST